MELHKRMSAPKELTLRSLLIGGIITIIFTASNVYLGLRVGMTFATSIPAAVISMAVLRVLGRGTLLENNIVQTQASAAGTLSCVFATLPGMILTGYWSYFPFWQTAAICFAGGVLGVLFTIPLRRSLVTNSSLPYPEGVAAAEILKTGHQQGHSQDLVILMKSCGFSAIFAFLSSGVNLIKDGFTIITTCGRAYLQGAISYSPALLGAGYLVGLQGAIAIIIGVVITWFGFLPTLTALIPHPTSVPVSDFIHMIWMKKIRFIGTGAIAVASLGTLVELLPSMMRGIKNIGAQKHGTTSPKHNQDLSFKSTALLGSMCLLIIGWLLENFLSSYVSHRFALILSSLIFSLIVGFILAAACGYMAGLIGSSTSPISGFIVMGVILLAFMIIALGQCHLLPEGFNAQHHKLAITFTIFLLSITVATITISNDNLQDLKTGEMVGASPWKQEIALITGCICSGLIIPPILNILYNAYGFAGSLPHPSMDPQLAFSAPQPEVIELISRGILTHSADWTMLTIGVVIGFMLVALDLFLRRYKLSCPPLGVTLGIYMPQSISITLAIGGCLRGFIEYQRKKHTSQQTENTSSIMRASGLIVGESLMGVVLALLPVSLKSHIAQSVMSMPAYSVIASMLGITAFGGFIWMFIRSQQAKQG